MRRDLERCLRVALKGYIEKEGKGDLYVDVVV